MNNEQGDTLGTVAFAVQAAATKEAVPWRIHLIDSAGKPVKPLVITLPLWRDRL